MVEDKMKTLSEKTQGFLNISKQVEEWAAKLPDPKAMKQFKDGKNLLVQARSDLDFILEMIDATQNSESPKKLPVESTTKSPAKLPKELPEELTAKSPAELPKESSAELPKESSAELPKESSDELPEGSPNELPKSSAEESPAKSPDKTLVKPPFKSNLSTDAPPWNPLVQRVPEAYSIVFHPEYPPSVEHPTPAVPIFYGDSRYWMVFKDSFERVVHYSPYLSIHDKVGYLVGYIDGDAKDLVASIPPTEENYDLIWNTLEAKYEDPSTRVVRYDFSPRTHTPNSHLESFYYLQEVLDYCFIVYNSLSSMQSESTGDYVVYEIVRSKLDSDLFKQLKKCLNQGQIPTFNQTSGFLQHYIQKMQRLSKEIKKVQFKNHKLGRSSGLITTTPDAKLCQFCKEATHKLFNCKGFLDLTPVNKYIYIKANNRCFNCLGERHSAVMCLSENVCAFCKKKHHSLLHDEEIQPDDHCYVKVSNRDGVETRTMSLPLYCVKPHSVILATAAVTTFENYNAYSLSARVLLDSASQCHLITNKCRMSLNLPLLPLDSTLTTVGDLHRGVMGSTIVKFSPYFNVRQTVSIMAYVIDHICYDLPSVRIAPRIKKSMAKFKLADPFFDIPAPIDLLIGSEIFPIALKKKQYRIPDSFCYGLETIFGWIVMGRAPAIGPVHPRFQFLCCVNALRHTLRRLNDINEFFYPEKFPELMKEILDEPDSSAECQENI